MLIKLSGFMGKDEEFELKDHSVMCGANGSGKTTIKNALEYVFTGSIGDLNTPGPIFLEYASDKFMEVEIDYNGLNVSRSITQSPAVGGGYKYTTGANINQNKRSIASGVKKVDEYLIDKFLPLVFSYEGFLRMKSTERRKTIVDMIGYQEPSKQSIIEMMKEKETPLTLLDSLFDKASLDDMITYATAERAFYNKEKKKYEGATASVNELKSAINGNLKTIDAIGKEYAEKQNELAKLKQEKYEAELIIKNIATDQSEIARVRSKIEEIEKTSYTSMIEQHLETIAINKALIRKVSSTKDYSKEKAKIQKTSDDLQLKLEKSSDELSYLMQDRAILTTKIKQLKELQSDITSFNGVCPVFKVKCTQDVSEGQHDTINTISEYEKQLSELGISELQEKHKELASQKIELWNSLKAIEQKELDELRIIRADEEHNNNIDRLTTKVEQAIEMLKEKELSKQQTIDLLKEQITQIESKKYDAYNDPDSIQMFIDVLDEKVNELLFKKESLGDKNRLLKTSIETSKLAEETTELYKEWDKAVKNLNDLKITLMSERLVPIKESVDLLLREIGINAELFFDLVDENGKDQLNFGWIREEVKVTNLSQGEHLLTSIGILAALQKYKEIPFKMLVLDEILILDANNANKLIQSKAIADLFDFVLLLSPYEMHSDLYETYMI